MQVSHQSTNFRWLSSVLEFLFIIRSAPTSQIDSAFRARAHREHTEADPKETLCTPKAKSAQRRRTKIMPQKLTSRENRSLMFFLCVSVVSLPASRVVFHVSLSSVLLNFLCFSACLLLRLSSSRIKTVSLPTSVCILEIEPAACQLGRRRSAAPHQLPPLNINI